MSESVNIARRLREAARRWPDRLAVAQPCGSRPNGTTRYREYTFRQLDDDSDRIAAGLCALGATASTKLVLFVPFSYEFIALTFGILKSGAVVVLIDPGMGRTNIFDCLREVRPDGFVAVPLVHAVRLLKRKLFPSARLNVTVGRRWLWGGTTYRRLLRTNADPVRETLAQSRGSDPAAIIFTSGSTGAPKGVLYEHGMFDAQVELIQGFYGIEPGEIDLPGFPLFGLFNAAMGVSTVIPDMDPTRPAAVDPVKIVRAIDQYRVTQAFGSPAFWNRVGRHCETTNTKLPTIRRGLSAGGPVPVHVLQRMTTAFTREGSDLHTPYGATESLPVSSIGGREVLSRTAALTAVGKGTCVGRPFPGMEVRIIAITDGPIALLADARELPRGEIGEIIVRGPSVTREYFQRPEATALAKIPVSPFSPTTDAQLLARQPSGGEGGRRPDEGASVRHATVVDDIPLTPALSPATKSSDGLNASSGGEGVCLAANSTPTPHVSRPSTIGPFFHRIGDIGYFDADGLLWFCGRKAHIVETARGPMYSVCCEAIFDQHPQVYRSALVGLGEKPRQTPVIIIEPEPGAFPKDVYHEARFRTDLLVLARQNPLTTHIDDLLFHPSLPVDTRHNVKINRDALAQWAVDHS
jgi:acyl-CoA synthetase (AMP-forming)/AMP-acid ligase II